MSKLTETILKIRETNSSDESIRDFLDTIEEMYKNDTWVTIPAFRNDKGQQFFSSIDLPIGNCVIILSDNKYFRNKFATDMIITSIRKVFDIYFENQDRCCGIAINPDTDAEMILTKVGIDCLNLNI